ncbi:methylmalonyl Co-A mutase-associated GTPase MeaB [Phascolarctobacterium sp.]|uniref:methylmalonyl Co-A mutase-associated GTPase MeaB n=1 Tax=Phascolarctobacterium sp. TaxID=2049039 RepID=UPI00386B9D6E
MPETGEKDPRPSWVPLEKDPNFACSVMGGIDSAVNSVSEEKYIPKTAVTKVPLRRRYTAEELVKGVSEGDRMILSKAITLIESNAPKDFDKAQRVLQALLPRTGKALRIGITGVPGAGKSTFIESFGQLLCRQGYKVAVLAVDPTSSITGGSILGDKTRMQMLSREPNCFIRPSPSKGTLGGVARKSRETMMLCEAAGCDVILVETVGVGQSETTVRSMVDFFMLVVLTGAGDELQGIKKGIMELADAIVVNKADGDNLNRAIVTQGEYERMVEFIRPATEGWKTHAYKCSALTKDGLLELWAVMKKFEKVTKASGVFDKRRKSQVLSWVHSMIDEHLHNLFFEDPMIKGRMPAVMEAVVNGVVSPSQAVTELIRAFDMDRASIRHLGK